MFNFARIPNNILETLIKSSLGKRQIKIVLCIARFSYGFNKYYARLNKFTISNITGLYPNAVNIELNRLISKKIIMADPHYTIFIINNTEEWLVGFNKKIDHNEYTNLIKKAYSKQLKKLSDLDKQTIQSIYKQRNKETSIDIKDNIDTKKMLNDGKKNLIEKYKFK